MVWDETQETDILVIGGGGAGTRAAIQAAQLGCRVILINKGPLARSGLTTMAGGGVAVVMGDHPQDSPRSHFEDTIKKGHYLGDQNLVQVLAEEAPARLKELEERGATGAPHPLLHTTGHSHPRGLFLKGQQLMSALKRWACSYAQNIRVIEDSIVTKLLVDKGTMAGAVAFDIREGEVFVIQARAVIVATGGLGELFPSTTNAPHGIGGGATGSGIALAYAVGAEIVDLEFIQFYPGIGIFPPITRNVHLNLEIASSLLGGTVRNGRGEAFLEEFVKQGMMVRDVSTKLAYAEIKSGRTTPHGGIYWDAGEFANYGIDAILDIIVKKHQDRGILSTARHLRAIGHSLAEPLEFRCGAHYACGGIRINEWAETNIPGLYAAGEAAGNLHGANRLAGNSVPDLLVFGKRAGESAAAYAQDCPETSIERSDVAEEKQRILGYVKRRPNGRPVREIRNQLHRITDDNIGPSRNAVGLKAAVAQIRALGDELPQLHLSDVHEFNITWVRAIETPGMLHLAEMIARSAMLRTESRGNHQREDYPQTDNRTWLRHTVVRLKDGNLEMSTAPVNLTTFSPVEECAHG